MSKDIVILQGHPDSTGSHLCHGLAEAYEFGAKEAGFNVHVIDVGALEFPLLRSADEWENGHVPKTLKTAQQHILQADHLVIVFPLWLGTMPALLKAFLEQVFRPGALKDAPKNVAGIGKLLTNKSVRIVVTMGMPAVAYWLFYRAHSVKSLQRNILSFVGAGPIFTTFVGLADQMNASRAKKLFEKMTHLGRSAR